DAEGGDGELVRGDWRLHEQRRHRQGDRTVDGAGDEHVDGLAQAAQHEPPRLAHVVGAHHDRRGGERAYDFVHRSSSSARALRSASFCAHSRASYPRNGRSAARWARYSRRRPSRRTRTAPARSSTRRCCETAPNVTSPTARWMCPALSSRSDSKRTIAWRRGSASATRKSNQNFSKH